MAHHPFRFGLQYFNPPDAATWRDKVHAAEDAGYDVFSLADHYLGPGPAAEAASHQPQTVAAIPAMATVAALTERIKVGSRVMCVDYHHPAVLAMQLATIEMLSEGRLEAGFGAGWIKSEYEALGVEWQRAGVRIDKLVEVVELARAWFTGAELDIDGTHVHASDMAAIPRSPRADGPPIMLGGGSPRVLRTAGRIADIVSINFDNSEGKIGARGIGSGTADGTAAKVDWIREGAGDRFEDLEIEIGGYFTAVTDARDATLAAMAKGFGMDTETFDAYPHAFVGSVDRICELLEERRERYGINYVTVSGKLLDDFAPVVEKMTGK